MYNPKTKKNRRTLALAFLLICQFVVGVTAQSPSPTKSDNPVSSEAPVLTPGNIDTKNFPSTIVNFSIEKKDKTLFRQLEYTDIEAMLDNQPVKTNSDSLSKGKDSEPIKVVFMIDRSGSMKIGNKIGAAKDALRQFVNSLNSNDEIAIYTFDESTTQVLSLTKVQDSSSINTAIEGIQTSSAKYTNFYDAVSETTRQTDKLGVRNVIFLSDGKEDTLNFNQLTTPEQSKEKSRRETELSNDLNKKGIRFFAVAIGDPNTLGEAFVDLDSMEKIAKTTSGEAKLIDLPEINRITKNNPEETKNEIANRLKTSLAEIKKSFKFAYALKLDLPKKFADSSGKLLINFNVTDGNKKWKLPATYRYSLVNGVPVFEKAEVGLPVFIETAISSLNFGNLFLIYILLLMPLTLLSGIPAVINKFTRVAEERKVSSAIVRVERNSPLAGKQCPNEIGSWGKRFAFAEGDTLIICPKCSAPHHLTCWIENKSQCMINVCRSRYEIPAKLLAKYNK
jgi:Mg-chelatase subunit ChlD